jgi:hypothetical protein
MSLHPRRYSFTISQGNYIFVPGRVNRGFRTFVVAVRPIDCPCVIASTPDHFPKDVQLPAHIRHVWATLQEFRQLLAGAMIVVVPMQAGHLHSGAAGRSQWYGVR